MNVPAFIRQPSGNNIESDIAEFAPRAVRAPDPLAPAVGELNGKAIMESGEAYVQTVLTEYRRGLEAAQALVEKAEAWAQSERERFRARAEDVEAQHREMMEARDKFLALPRVTDKAATFNPSPTKDDYAQLSG